MWRSNIDIHLVQETWLEGKGKIFKQLQTHDHTLFLHGNEDVTCSGQRGGVGIFLSKRVMKAWTHAGSHKPDLSGVVAECPHFMGMKHKRCDVWSGTGQWGASLNKRLLKILTKHGVETQRGSQKARVCQDGLFVLRSALETRRQHDSPTWVLLVDLVKAFDTVNHELLFALLERHGAPEPLADAVRRMHTDMNVKLRIGKEECDMPHTVGAHQDNNMAGAGSLPFCDAGIF
jgi:hypothetical protein